MYKHNLHKQCLVALVCVLAAAAGDAKDCAGKLPRAAERFKTRLAAATAGCQVVVYTTLFYPPGVRLPHPSTRLGPAAHPGLHSESFVRTALEDARVRPVFSASPCGHRVRVRGTESVTDCNATEAEPGRHQCLPLRDLKFPPGV